jgi:hypothetical protein
MSGREILNAIGPIEGLGAVVGAAETGMAETPGLAAACVEFAAEGLWLTRRIDKDDTGSGVTYTSSAPTDRETNS